MDRHEERVIRGNEAAQLLENPMLQQAFADTRQGIMEAWAQLPHSSADEQSSLLLMVKCLDKVKRAIEYHITTGKVAAVEVEKFRKAGIFDQLNPFRGS